MTMWRMPIWWRRCARCTVDEYVGSEWVPAVTDEHVLLLALKHSQFDEQEFRRGQWCRACRQTFPCDTYRLAVEVLLRRDLPWPSTVDVEP